jgi:TRAP-type C4-dicarboxylate transport system substrate-binding protein
MKSLRLFAAAVLALLAVQTASAQPAKLNLITLSLPTSLESKLLHAWAREVEARSKNAVEITVSDGHIWGNFGNVVDQVMNNVAQIGWTIQAFFPGKYGLSGVAGLPALGHDQVAGSVALWRLYKTGLLDSEYRDVAPIWLAQSSEMIMHFAKPPKSIDDLRGLKILIAGARETQQAKLLGMAPQSLPAQDMYSALQRGTVDAVMTTWPSFIFWKLAEVTSYELEPHLGSSTQMFFMARKKYEALPASVRGAIDSLSEETARDWTATFVKEINDAKAALDKTKHTIVQLSPAQQAEWDKKLALPVIAQWEKANSGSEKVLATYKKLYAEAEKELARRHAN